MMEFFKRYVVTVEKRTPPIGFAETSKVVLYRYNTTDEVAAYRVMLRTFSIERAMQYIDMIENRYVPHDYKWYKMKFKGSANRFAPYTEEFLLNEER